MLENILKASNLESNHGSLYLSLLNLDYRTSYYNYNTRLIRFEIYTKYSYILLKNKST